MLGTEISHALISTHLNQYLDSSELELLISHMDVVSFLPGSFILKQGKDCSGIYIIIDGVAMVTTKTLGSETTNIATLKSGDFIGEISVLTNEPSLSSVVATNSVRCLLITKVYLEFLSLFFPELKYKILLAIAKQICYRLKNTSEKITTFLENSNMITQPLLGRVITSLKKPVTLNEKDEEIDLEKLKNTEFFSMFTKEEYDVILKNSNLIKAEKQCTLINEKDKDASCYIVICGAVQSSIIHNNIVAKLSVIGPLILFCGISTIDPTSSSTIDFTTCESAILFKITPTELEIIQNNHKQLWNKLFNLICKSIVALEKSVQKLNIRLDIELYNR